MLRLAGTLVAALSLMLAVTVRMEEHRVLVAETRAAAAALAATNTVAERDSTRDVARSSHAVALLLGDSLRLAERRVVQLAQRSDALDAAIGGERRARYDVTATVDSLQRLVTAHARHDSSHAAWAASFALRQPPYTIRANVLFPEPPDSAQLDMRVQLHSIHVEARVMCAAPNADGVRAAGRIVAGHGSGAWGAFVGTGIQLWN